MGFYIVTGELKSLETTWNDTYKTADFLAFTTLLGLLKFLKIWSWCKCHRSNHFDEFEVIVLHMEVAAMYDEYIQTGAEFYTTY